MEYWQSFAVLRKMNEEFARFIYYCYFLFSSSCRENAGENSFWCIIVGNCIVGIESKCVSVQICNLFFGNAVLLDI